METAQKPTEDGLDWENRRLCRDENCIGIIGPDGRCKECGLPAADEDLGEKQIKDPAESDPDAEKSGAGAFEGTEDAPDSMESEGCLDHDWQTRQLCPDGNCIGVIGSDGRCKICGQRAEAQGGSDPQR